MVSPKMRDDDELSLTMALICQRELFGRVYQALQPDYFWMMPKGSGVLIRPTVTTAKVVPNAVRPGDIDLLIIPYHDRELILERTLAIEIKAIRATYEKQGRSPNDYGFSQADALSALGFPYVAVLHLIISNESPEHAWRMMTPARVLDEYGRVELLQPQPFDMLPSDLMNRAYGRLLANSKTFSHGLAAVYVDRWLRQGNERLPSTNLWFPSCRPALFNPRNSQDLMDSVANYYEQNKHSFFATLRHDP